MIELPDETAEVRKKIENLSRSLSLPTVRKALGLFEGEHSSKRPFGSDDIMDIRKYEPGDEARLIDWKTSARMGRPMLVQRERLVTSHIWLLMDVGVEMSASCSPGERASDVACNALCMFAALSLRRGDDLSLVLGDSFAIKHLPFHGGLARFEYYLDTSVKDQWVQPRNIDALLSYARTIVDPGSLIVLVTDEHALEEGRIKQISTIAQTHPLVVIDIATMNPFARHGSEAVFDGNTHRKIPAFMINATIAQEVDTHRQYRAAALNKELTRRGSTMIRPESSKALFTQFVQIIATSQTWISTQFQPGAGLTTKRSRASR